MTPVRPLWPPYGVRRQRRRFGSFATIGEIAVAPTGFSFIIWIRSWIGYRDFGIRHSSLMLYPMRWLALAVVFLLGVLTWLQILLAEAQGEADLPPCHMMPLIALAGGWTMYEFVKSRRSRRP